MTRAVVIGVSSVLLVAMVAAVAIAVSRNTTINGNSQVTSSSKAVERFCASTDYRKTCEESLSSAGTATDPNDLTKLALNATIKQIQDVIKNSTILEQAEKDPKTMAALKNCKELLEFSIDDLMKSLDRIGKYEVSNIDGYVSDLKTWLSAAVTYQETCLDGFEEVEGDAGEKMWEFLEASGELSRNALAFIEEAEKTQSPKGRRRLLSSGGFPAWVDAGRRKLLQTGNYNNLVPNVVVSKNGQYKTINDALKAVPTNNTNLFVIQVEAGLYEEYVHITKQMSHVALVGAGMGKTIISGNKNKDDGVEPFNSATVVSDGSFVFLNGLTIENTAGHDKYQAVALRVSGDQSIIYHCEITGYQNTLYAHAERQLYYNCTITGTIDFVFGDAAAVFQKCRMIIRKPGEDESCTVTAQARSYKRQTTGFVLQQCRIMGDDMFNGSEVPVKAYLGRPSRELSRTVIMESEIESVIDPEGWVPWVGTLHLDTCMYAEYHNMGGGANTDSRVKWLGYKRGFGPQDAAQYTATKFISADTWVKPTGLVYIPNL